MIIYYAMKAPHEKLKLPPLLDTTAVVKLVWLYLACSGSTKISTRDIAKELGVSEASAQTSFQTLKKLGLLVETVPSAGSSAATLKAVEPHGMEKLL
jgi:biotin operon repressor